MSLLTAAARMWLTRSPAPFRFTPDYDQPLPLKGARGLGLYVHIPFCRSLCSFCPYCKVPWREALAREYLEGLLAEIRLVGEQWQGRRQAGSLYFGGGSPALLARRLGEIVSALEEHFTLTGGIGVELHPRDVTEETLSLLRDAGVDRICVGIQSFQADALAHLGRERPDPAALGEALRRVPFPTVSADFIFALPGQDPASLRRDVLLAEEMGANHLAFYPFIDFSFTPSRTPALPLEEKRRLLEGLTAFLRERGYLRDSIWTFAREPGRGYSSMTRSSYLGFGCSAATLLAEQFKVNTFSIPAYLERVRGGRLPTALTCRFTPRQRMVYHLFWQAYTTRVSGGEFRAQFGMPLERAYPLELRCARALGWVRRDGEDWRVTDAGAFQLHRIEGPYTLSYIQRMWSLLGREAFPGGMVL